MADNEVKPDLNKKMFIQLSEESKAELRKKNIKILNNGLLELNSTLKLKDDSNNN